MKKSNLIGGLFLSLLLVSSWVGADAKYPAYDFEPTIVFQDESVIAATKLVSPPTPPPVVVTEKSLFDDPTLFIGIALLACILWFAYKKSSCCCSSKKIASKGSTGVSRYLNDQVVSTPLSGVDKYLQERS